MLVTSSAHLSSFSKAETEGSDRLNPSISYNVCFCSLLLIWETANGSPPIRLQTLINVGSAFHVFKTKKPHHRTYSFQFSKKLLRRTITMSLPSNGGATKRKAPDEVPGDSVTLKVLGQDGRFLHFSVKRHTPMIKVMRTYCERKELDYSTMRFFYKGNRIHGKQTPARLSMEENDEISALMQQMGGGRITGLAPLKLSTA